MVREGDARLTAPETEGGGWDAPRGAAGALAARAAERELAGRTLADRYDLLALIGAGGMGAVYRAYDRELDELVALKVIKAELARQPVMVDRFRHEVKLARRVTHINVARTFELGQVDGVMYCTMELVDGESLQARLAREGKLAAVTAAGIASALCDGLAAAHAVGVIHRDIKPDNVLLAESGRVVLADFGVASAAADAESGQLSGTPAYMAPEQARGEPPTPATDVYAVGVLVFEMVTGLRAFPGGLAEVLIAKQDVAQLEAPPGSMPPELAQVIGRATLRDPAGRIQTPAELCHLLVPWTGACALAAAAPRRPAAAGDLRTVVVLPPSGDEARVHLAAGVHEELLRRLMRRPHVRVLPRADQVEVPNATVVELRAGELLAVAIRRDGAVTSLHLPLDVASFARIADTIAGAVIDAGARAGAAPADPRAEAVELLLRARVLAQRSLDDVRRAIELLERAHALWPEEPRIAATLGMLFLRLYAGVDDLTRVRSLVRGAFAAAPELPEAHVAAGYLELHTGDPAVAAAHFRRAIARSPYTAEAHEGLGRMLLEAGFLDHAMARIEDARAISPDLTVASWEIARAHALEQNWIAYDGLVATLTGQRDRVMARLRIAWWRGDLAQVAALAGNHDASHTFEPRLTRMFREVALAAAWPVCRDEILAHVRGVTSQSLRHRVFIAQIAAEAAGHAGDEAACNDLIEHAVAHGLFDLHWLRRCPPLELARRTARWAAAYARVKHRAEAILDALYGDAEAVSDTLIA